MKTIIFGNGVNINFDNDKKRWANFATDCYANFLVKMHDLEELSKNNWIAKYNFRVWQEIKKAINFDSPFLKKNIEHFLTFFNIGVYLEDEFGKEFLTVLYAIFLASNPHISKDNGPIEVDINNLHSIMIVNSALTNLSDVFAKVVLETLDEYKLGEIKYSKKFIDYVNQTFDTKITTNYDLNGRDIMNLFHLHGSINDKLATGEDVLKLDPKLVIDHNEVMWKDWYLENTIQNTDIVLSSSSILKQQRYEIGERFSKFSYKDLMSRFGLNVSDLDIKINVKNNYDALKSISGEVVILGISEDCDEVIFQELENNPKITKIEHYSDNNSSRGKYTQFHYSDFWRKLESESKGQSS